MAGPCVALLVVVLLAPHAVAATSGPPPILLSRQVMEAAELAVGDVVRLASSPDGSDPREYRVVGSYEPTPDPMRLTQDRHEARLHLPDLIDHTVAPDDPEGRESVDSINVAATGGAAAVDALSAIGRRFPGLMVVPTSATDGSNPFVVLERFHAAIAAITVIGSTAFLLALMVMRADERRETVGILRLLGLGKRRVLLEVFFEGLMLAVAGALFGVLLAIAAQDLFNRFFQWRYDTALVFVRIDAATALKCLAIAVPMGVLAGVVASWNLLRRGVLELIRR